MCVFGASLALPQAASTLAPKTPPKTTVPKAASVETAAPKSATPKAAPKTAVTKKTGTGTKTAATGKKTYKSTKKGGPPAQTWRNRQLAPTATRYKEIQQALADKGYLKAEPSGVWDTQSEEALKQFQTEKNLPPSGKINAPSLIGLGLGPKAPDPIISPPNTPTKETPPEPPATPQP